MSIPEMQWPCQSPSARAPCSLSAQSGFGQEGQELPFAEAQLYFELNHTDGDLGFHGLIDGDAWKSLEIESPQRDAPHERVDPRQPAQAGNDRDLLRKRRAVLRLVVAGPVLQPLPGGGVRGGGHHARGRGAGGRDPRFARDAGTPRGNIKINGKNSAVNCDAALPVVSEPVILDWNAVTKSHPTVGTPNVNVTVLTYEVVGEIEREGQNPEVLVFSVMLPRNVTAFEFPETFTGLADG